MLISRSRRDFIKGLISGLIAGAGALYIAGPSIIARNMGQERPEAGTEIPSIPIKIGIQAFRSGPGAPYGEDIHRGAILAIEEINDEGGLFGRRKITYVQTDEKPSPDETIKEYQRLVRDEKIDFYIGIVSSGNASALAPVAEELGTITLFVLGLTDALFEKIDPEPRFVFRVQNIQSAGAASNVIAGIKFYDLLERDRIRVSHIHPDYALGRDAQLITQIVLESILGKDRVEVVSEDWPKLFAGEYGSFIAKMVTLKPDIIITSLWGGDFLTFYRQALAYGLLNRSKLITLTSFEGPPNIYPSDFPEGHIYGVFGNYFFLYPDHNVHPVNRNFVESFLNRWNQYPSSPAAGAYTAVYMLKAAIEKAYMMLGRWPEADDVIEALEGLSIVAPAGVYYIRASKPEKHQAYHDAIVGISGYDPRFVFPILTNPIFIPISTITAPEGWSGSMEPSIAANYYRSLFKPGQLPI